MGWRPQDKQRSLFIFGDNGTCKTRLACQLANSLQYDFGPATFRPYQKFVVEISSFGQSNFKGILDSLVKCPLLVFDDMTFTASSRETEARIAFMVVDGRYRNRLPTIITSNNGLESITGNWFLNAIGKRIAFSYGHAAVKNVL
jgi:DNA replication protein DnaC